MNTQRKAMTWIVAGMLIALAGCTPAPTRKAQPSYLGTLVVSGGNYALVNRRPAYTGTYIRDYDIVSTGPGTSARIYLQWGGFLQLDENTDPLLQLLREGGCLLFEVARGQAYVDAEDICLDDNRDLQSKTKSQVNLWTDGVESRLTVAGGHVQVTSPDYAALQANDQYTVGPNGRGYQTRLTPEQTAAVIAWTTRYAFPPPPALPPPPPPPPPPRETQLDVIVPVLSALLFEKFGGDHGGSRNHRPQPTGTPPAPEAVPPHGDSHRGGSTTPRGSPPPGTSPPPLGYTPSDRTLSPRGSTPTNTSPPSSRSPACNPRNTNQIQGHTATHCPRPDSEYVPAQRQRENGDR
jgi:hypothetical protein